MFRKIHSNRDPGLTLGSELAREFSVYILCFKSGVAKLFSRKPWLAFSLMALLILLSFCYVFVVCKPVAKPKPVPTMQASPLSVPEKGIGQIMQQAAGLKESLAIKAGIEALIAKDSLTAADSVQLEKAINRLHELSIH